MPFSRLWSQPYVLLSLTSLFWAGNAVVGRAVSDELSPVILSELRWVGAFLLMLPFAWPGLKRDWPVIRRSLPRLAVLSLASIVVFNAMLYWSLARTTAINAVLMQSSGPLLIGVWSFLLFSDPLTRRQALGILASLLGVAVIVTEADIARIATLHLNTGDLTVLAATAVYALYSAMLRLRPPIGAVSFATCTIGMGAVMLLPALVAEAGLGAARFAFGPAASLAIAYVVVFPSILAFLFFNRGVELIGANRAGPFFHLVPLFGAVLAVLFLGERLASFHLVGATLILGGVVVASRRAASSPGTPPSP